MRAAVFAGALAALLAACAPDGSEGAGADAGPAPEAGSAGNPALLDDYRVARVVDLGQGSHSVFGLRIPGGMRPAPGPHLVYRFEGTWELTAARRFVMRQMETALLNEEPAGYLIRHARVLEPAGEGDPSLRLAIRIFRGRKGGATIDVWVERDRQRERTREASGGGTAGRADGKAARIEPGSPEALRRAEQGRATFEMMEQLGRGEAPSAEDADNPFFR
jgi:hypothetical protein